MNKPPYIIVEKEYWKCPIHVLTGITWLCVGLGIGILLGVFL